MLCTNQFKVNKKIIAKHKSSEAIYESNDKDVLALLEYYKITSKTPSMIENMK